MSEPILSLALQGLPKKSSGKVRDLFDLGDTLLLAATDRLSAFDVVMPNGIPDKGRVLTSLSAFWFDTLRAITPNHYLSSDDSIIAERLQQAGAELTPETRAALKGRAMLCAKAVPLPIECVVRGYLAGSLWKEYREAGGATGPVVLHGIALPGGLRECDPLPEPIFTPATKAARGHDENISAAEAAELTGREVAQEAARLSIALYNAALEKAKEVGLMLADTKFEFGLREGRLLLIDEALTPDSSRYWEAALYEPGKSQPSFDKQFVRDWLESTGWDKAPPGPMLPEDIVKKTADKYREAYRRLTGGSLPEQ